MEKWEFGESLKYLATFMQIHFQENHYFYFEYVWDRCDADINLLDFLLLREVAQKDWVLYWPVTE